MNMEVDVLKENRHLVVEHLQIEHPLTKGDIIILTPDSKEYREYEVIRSMVTVFKKKRKSVGKVVATVIIVKEIVT